MSRTMMADVTRFTLTSTHMALFRVWNCSAFAPQSGGDSSQCTRERKNSEACTLPGRLANAECEWEHEVSCERCSCSPSKFMKSKIVSCAVLRGARRHFDNEIYHLESFAKCLHVSLLLSALTSRPVEKKKRNLITSLKSEVYLFGIMLIPTRNGKLVLPNRAQFYFRWETRKVNEMITRFAAGASTWAN